MTVRRHTWTECIPKAFAEASSARGDRLRPRDVVEVLARDLHDTDRHHIAENVSKYVHRDSDGIYRLSRPGGIRPDPPNAGDRSSPGMPALASHDFLVEIRRMHVDERLQAFDEALRTCHGQYCDRLDELKAQLTAFEASLSEKVKAAVDSRSVMFDERLKSIEVATASLEAPPTPAATNLPLEPSVQVEIPGDRVFECPKCGDALVIGQARCPNATCEETVDWTVMLNPGFLREVERELEDNSKEVIPPAQARGRDLAR